MTERQNMKNCKLLKYISVLQLYWETADKYGDKGTGLDNIISYIKPRHRYKYDIIGSHFGSLDWLAFFFYTEKERIEWEKQLPLWAMQWLVKDISFLAQLELKHWFSPHEGNICKCEEIFGKIYIEIGSANDIQK